MKKKIGSQKFPRGKFVLFLDLEHTPVTDILYAFLIILPNVRSITDKMNNL